MEKKGIMGNQEGIFGIIGKWTPFLDKSLGVLNKSVDIYGKAQQNSYKATLNELAIKEKLQAIEDNKNDREATRKRIDELFRMIVNEHEEYVFALKEQGMFIEKKKEVNDDWKSIIDYIDKLNKHYLK